MSAQLSEKQLAVLQAAAALPYVRDRLPHMIETLRRTSTKDGYHVSKTAADNNIGEVLLVLNVLHGIMSTN